MTDQVETAQDDTVQDDAVQAPAAVWAEMVEGNARFVAGTPQHPRQDVERRAALAHVQRPVAALFGCSDSRLAAEIIFDKGLGDLFVIRNAGQIISDSVLGSLEYAVGVLGVPLIVVLGHDECGAVRAAIESAAPGAEALPPHIANLIAPIAPAVHRVAGDHVVPSEVDAGEVGRQHLRGTVTRMLEASEMISDKVAAGSLAIVGANYKLLEGTAVPDVIVGDIPR